VYENRLEVLFADKPQLVVERLRGRHGHRIDYRHVIRSLVLHHGSSANALVLRRVLVQPTGG